MVDKLMNNANKCFELNTPVAYVIFNRPDCVEKSFESIRRAQPKELYIIADGPRIDHPEDKELCEECRKIVDNIDWDCEVHKEYSDINMGCGLRPATGFSWVFSQVDRAIIIEDDCVPSMSFYRFCQEMLERYYDDKRVYTVSGMNWGFTSNNESDYFFSHYSNSTGWATWRRVWDQYDFEIKTYCDEDIEKKLENIMLEPAYVRYWTNFFKMVYNKEIKSAWDYQFTYLSFVNNGLHIFPQKNLVSYIGYSDQATHPLVISEDDRFYYSTRKSEDIDFPLNHPKAVQEDFRIDYLIMREIFYVSTSEQKICKKLQNSVINEINRYSEIIIYGAGVICRDVIRLLGSENIDKFHIAVTSLDGDKKYVMGNEVHEISDFMNIADKSIVLIAVSKKNQMEIKENLKKLLFKNIIEIDY